MWVVPAVAVQSTRGLLAMQQLLPGCWPALFDGGHCSGKLFVVSGTCFLLASYPGLTSGEYGGNVVVCLLCCSLHYISIFSLVFLFYFYFLFLLRDSSMFVCLSNRIHLCVFMFFFSYARQDWSFPSFPSCRSMKQQQSWLLPRPVLCFLHHSSHFQSFILYL